MRLLCVTVLWIATGYRILIMYRKGYARWRVYLAGALACLTIATTLYFSRAEVNDWLGVPNAAALINRVILTTAWVFVQLYTLDLKKLPPVRRVRATRLRLVAAALVVTVMTVAWILAPIHTHDLPDFAPVAASPAVVIYTVGFYGYIVWLLLDLGTFAHKHAAAMAATDRPGSLAAGLIAAACYLGLPVMALFTSNVLTAAAGHANATLDRLGNLLFPVPMAVLAMGMLMLPLLPQITRRRNALKQLRDITPLWAHLVQTHPDVHLELPGASGVPLLHPEVTVQRRLIEVADALESVTVGKQTAPNLTALAIALAGPSDDGPSAKNLLQEAATPASDDDSLLALGRAFRKHAPGTTGHVTSSR